MGNPIVKTFHVERIRTLTGSGVRLRFGSYLFLLVGIDGTPERTLDDAGYAKVVQAIAARPEQVPNIGQREGKA